MGNDDRGYVQRAARARIARVRSAAFELFDAAEAMLERHDQYARDRNFQWCGCDECQAFRPIVDKVKAGSK